jgi:hypothetical protein
MRMSSGASKRKLMPLSGVFSCGDETPMSSSTPSTCATPRPVQHRVELAEGGMYQREARIGDRAACGNCRRIAIQRHQPPLRPQRGKNRPAVAAATEGGIDVNSMGSYRQGRHRLG